MRGRHWLAAELDFIQSHRNDMTAAQIADHFGDRSANAVTHAARKRGIKLEFGKGHVARRFTHPNGRVLIGARTLIAKTCTQCGRLLEARRYSRRTDERRRGYWQPACRSCCMANATPRDKTDTATAKSKYRNTLDYYTSKLAYNTGTYWTAEQLDVVRDTSKSLIEVAVLVGRTYSATSSKARALGVNRQPNPDQGKSWVVVLAAASVEVALQLERAGLLDSTGIPTEDAWDWNDSDLAVAS